MRTLATFIFFSRMLLAQTGDSLIHELMQVQDDTERVNQLYKHGFGLRNSDPAYAFTLAKLCEEQALLCRSDKHLAKSYNLLGILFYKRADYTKAIQYHRMALQLRKDIGDKLGIAISQTNLGNIYTDLQYYNLAETAYLGALRQYHELQEVLQATRCLINLGVLRHEQRHTYAALRNFKEALALAGSANDYENMAICNNNIGGVLAELGQLDTALLYAEEGLKMRYLLDNEVEMADSYLNLADICTRQKKYSEAADYLNQAEKIVDMYNYPEAKVQLYKCRANLCRDTRDYEKAYEYLQKQYTLRDSLQRIEKDHQVFLDNETSSYDHTSHQKQPLRNKWLMMVCLLAAVIVPVTLIRYKR